MRIGALIVLAFFAAGMAPLRATVVVGTDLAELTRDARTIARGRVVSAEGQWSDDHRRIETLVTLEVDSYLKGPLGATLQFRVPGGELGRYRNLFVGAPEFASDERVIVFLNARGPTVPYVLGLNQGVFRIARSIDGSRWIVIPPPALPPATAATRLVRGDPSRTPMPLADFEQQLRALVAGTR